MLCSASVNALQIVFSNSSYGSTAKWETCQIFKRGETVGVHLAVTSVTKRPLHYVYWGAAVPKVMMAYINHGGTPSAERNTGRKPKLCKRIVTHWRGLCLKCTELMQQRWQQNSTFILQILFPYSWRVVQYSTGDCSEPIRVRVYCKKDTSCITEKWWHQLCTNPWNVELNPISHLQALLGAHSILHVSRIMVNKEMCIFHMFQLLCSSPVYVNALRHFTSSVKTLAVTKQAERPQHTHIVGQC